MGISFSNIGRGLKDTFSSPKNFIKNAADPGSILFGGASTKNSLGMNRNTSDGTLIDWFGSPVTAGTKTQDAARLAALIYGAWMGAGALGGGTAGSTGATSASYAPAAMDVPAAGGLGGLGGGYSMPAAVAEAPGSVAALQGGTTTTAGGMPAWMKYARMGNMASNFLGSGQGGGGQQPYFGPGGQVQVAQGENRNPFAGWPQMNPYGPSYGRY